MSIRIKALRFIEEILDQENKQLNGMTVCTMGNLNTKRESRDYLRKKEMQGYGRFQQHLKALGAEVTVIDINPLGGDSVLHYDLGRPILDPNLKEKFDLVIDGGTGEHIDNQFEFFKNVFNFLKVGGVTIHMLPCYGWWLTHARWTYDFRWFEDFAAKNNVQVLDIRQSSDCYEIPFDRQVISCAMKKTASTNIISFADPYQDEVGVQKNDKCYNRWVLPARAHDETQRCVGKADQ